MTCSQLGGPEVCRQKFTAKNFDEMAELSKRHGMEMFQKGDEAHMAAGKAMQELMENPQALQEWFEQKRREFEDLAEDGNS